MTKKIYKLAFLFLILFYLIGTAGIIIPSTYKIFINLIPVAILLSTIILLFFHHSQMNLRIATVFFLIAFLAYFAEVAGVKTGIIFGYYIYGDTLGLKLLETPLLIGLNWVMLIYCSKVIADRLTDSPALNILTAPLLMIAYDIVLEQCAPALRMWYWHKGNVPLRNYLAWFLLAFIFHLIVKSFKISYSNKMALPVFIVQFLFFVILTVYFSLSAL